MNASMINSSAALSALQRRIDIIANNVANVNTNGYKRKEAVFQDILTSRKQQVESMQLAGRLTPLGLTEGWGARLARQQVDLSQGSLVGTDKPTDLALEGDALFELAVPVLDENGEPVLEDGVPVMETTWTRDGSFQLSTIPGDPDNLMLTTRDGRPVLNADGLPIAVPAHHRMVIDAAGNITAYNDQDEAIALGRLRLVRVIRPQLLESVGDNRYALPADTARDDVFETLVGADRVAEAGIVVHQGFLEQSNVNLTEEMTELIAVQRAFQLSARALTSADTMLNLANNLRGS
jgi:flagellar basal-body rod protein FlgG